MSIEEQKIADKVEWEERRKKRKELNERRKTEGKNYEIAVDYQINMSGYDEHFHVTALDLDDALDQICEEIANDHNVDAGCDVEVGEPEVISEAGQDAALQKALSCPACGAADIEVKEEQRSIAVPYGPEVSFAEVVCTCNACKTSGDFRKENTVRILQALAKSQTESAKVMLQKMTEGPGEFTLAYIERALRLPVGSLKLWKMGLLSETAVSLLRIVYTFPWLLQVADADFQPEITRKICESYLRRFIQDQVARFPVLTSHVK